MIKNNKSKNVFNVKNKEDSYGFLLWQITTIWQRKIKSKIKKYNITHSQFVILASLMWFSQKGEYCNQILLSQHTKIDKATTGDIISNLENKQLITREINIKDNRSYIIKLTKKGNLLIPKVINDVENIDKKIFDILSNKEKEYFKSICLKIENANI